MKVNEIARQTEIGFSLMGQNLVIDVQKALYWSERNALIVSDLHLGKAGHFRKHGIPVPAGVHATDMQRLDHLLKKYAPESVIFLGDLFHSEWNEEWEHFVTWVQNNRKLHHILVRGNHDILHPEVYGRINMEICDDLLLKPFHFTHQPTRSDHYNLAGHVHPGVKLRGNARQGVKLPCFLFSERAGLFPAFGSFTGSYTVAPVKGDQVFALTGHSVIGLMA